MHPYWYWCEKCKRQLLPTYSQLTKGCRYHRSPSTSQVLPLTTATAVRFLPFRRQGRVRAAILLQCLSNGGGPRRRVSSPNAPDGCNVPDILAHRKSGVGVRLTMSIAKMKRRGEGRLENGWHRVIEEILLLSRSIFDILYQNGIHAVLLEGEGSNDTMIWEGGICLFWRSWLEELDGLYFAQTCLALLRGENESVTRWAINLMASMTEPFHGSLPCLFLTKSPVWNQLPAVSP